MDLTLAYLGQSRIAAEGGRRLVGFAPNLSRERVAFDAALLQPLRFREAISALHDVVMSDLRFKPKDKAAYELWKAEEDARLAALRKGAYAEARADVLARRETPVPDDLEKNFQRARRRYWNARGAYSRFLQRHDPALWRMLMPCDPVITVADDVLFFECFSADESSYGCLSVEREQTFGAGDALPGTTNVDYSWDLYWHFQTLRTYRETRFRVDPAGFEVAVEGRADYREEKIDVPPGWLRGFLQIQAAMTLPARKVTLPREAVYSLLAWLKRHKARTSPRAVRFELVPGQAPTLVLEPWERRIVAHGHVYQGPHGAAVRIWGRRRLLALARVLPLLDQVDVYLLGTGLPSFWVARMGEMRLTLGLSGWTANDWTRSTALDLLAPPVEPDATLVDDVAAALRSRRAAALPTLQADAAARPAACAAALNRLARSGQVIYDLSAGVYRWRPVMPQALGEADVGRENPEQAGARDIAARRRVAIESTQEAPGGGLVLIGQAEGTPCELLLDADGRITRGKCVCSHHYRYGIRTGPCRHLLALRHRHQQQEDGPRSDNEWYERLRKWVAN